MLPESIDRLLKKYEHNALLKGLVQLVPFGVGAVADAAVLAHAEKLRAERVRVFFDELASGEKSLNPELISNDEFLHCFMATSSAAIRCHRQEKIRAFARMLLASTIKDRFSCIDDFEEYLRILDDLSFRELLILQTLENHENANPKGGEENDLQRAVRFWKAFSEEVSSAFGVPTEEIDAMMTRLNRTGCYETFTGQFYDYTGGKGKLTPTYFRLKSLIAQLDKP